MDTGFMEDRDWMGPNGSFSHYSRHNSRAGEGWFHDFLGGLSLPFGSRILFKPFLGLSYTRLKWIASDGYTRYLDNSYQEVPLYGRVISYTQEWLVPFFGASLSYAFHPRFSAGLSFRLSPLLYFTGLDEHHLKGVEYYDYIWGGFYFEPGGEAVFKFNKRFSAGLYVSWRSIKGNHGLTYRREAGGLFESYTAGAAWQTLDSGIRAAVHF
jgi:outer membrane protease